MKLLGLIGGMSWESTDLYYQGLNRLARERFGGLASAELLLYSYNFARIEMLQAKGDWASQGQILTDTAKRLEQAGAAAIVITSNTMHKVAPQIEAAISIPILHICDAAGAAMKQQSLRHPLLLATRYTMQEDFYTSRLAAAIGGDVQVPDAADRDVIHAIIYNELCQGIISASSRAKLQAIIEKNADKADCVVLACTELGLILSEKDVRLPLLDTTPIHIKAAFEFACG